MDAGHVVVPSEDPDALLAIRKMAAEQAAFHLGLESPADAGAFLESVHGLVDSKGLNALRLSVFQGLNRVEDFRRQYYALASRALAAIVGNELAMQRRINLSIQLPDDDSSLLPVHADVWSGDSPFEIVLWVPLVDCFGTKSMYLLPPQADATVQSRLADFAGSGTEDLFQAIADDVTFLSVPFGSVLLFSPNLMHGNRINREQGTRWSFNCRFKAVLSPYADKRLGEFFEPLVIRPATRLGMAFRQPRGFHV
jgi:sporadic carbohydrate cluster 2OG-Fe(II) oxygenase